MIAICVIYGTNDKDVLLLIIGEIMKHVVCYSGGHSSALVAIEVVRKYGKENVILLNHDISSWVEDADVKRFKKEVSEYLNIPITFCNIDGVSAEDLPDQFDVVMKAKAFKVGEGSELCTNRLKTAPFHKWLAELGEDVTIYYGFDANEKVRIQRRVGILSQMGYKSDYPLAFWERTIFSTKEIGVEPPLTYGVFKHANCVGCLKAGKQHWYIVYCTRPDIYKKALLAEDFIGYTIIKDISLEELIPVFEDMKLKGIEPTERIPHQTFWANVRKVRIPMIEEDADKKPCECVF